jgi:two-component sensor histidine kinase
MEQVDPSKVDNADRPRPCQARPPATGGSSKSVTKFAPGSCSEEQMLLRELNHRINNEFTSIISMATLAAARSGNEEVKTALNDVAERVHQYADVHRALKMPQPDTGLDAVAHLRQLCLSIGRSKLDLMRIKLVFEACPLTLSSDRCWRLGMIVHELVTNAARHAFADRDGEIRVELSQAGPLIQCRVLDNGSGLATFQPGQGTKIVRYLAQELGGHIEHYSGPYGSTVIVVFPTSESRTVGATMGRDQASSPRLNRGRSGLSKPITRRPCALRAPASAPALQSPLSHE